jgi:hypothetical protein
MEQVKQTAVEWLIQNIVEDQTIKAKSISEWTTIYEQAKAMEKEQISQSYTTGVEEDVWNNPLRTGEMYYEETYGGNK